MKREHELALGERLRNLRGSTSQRQLGQWLGYPRTTISDWETGTRLPRSEVLEDYAEWFGNDSTEKERLREELLDLLERTEIERRNDQLVEIKRLEELLVHGERRVEKDKQPELTRLIREVQDSLGRTQGGELRKQEQTEIKRLEEKLRALLEDAERKRPWLSRVSLRVGAAVLAVVGMILALIISLQSSPSGAPHAVLYRFARDDRCRLNTAPYRSFLIDGGYRLDGPIAEVEVSEETGAKKLLSYTIAPEPNGTRYYVYVREDDFDYLNRLKAENWEVSGSEADPNYAGLVYREHEPGTTQLWRARKGRWAYCFSLEKEELESRGYTDLAVVGYVWPP